MSTIKILQLACQLNNLHNLQKGYYENFVYQWNKLSPEEQSEVIETSIYLEKQEKNYVKKT